MTIPEGKIRRSIVFPADLYKKLQQQATQKKVYLSSLVCHILEKYLEEKRS